MPWSRNRFLSAESSGDEVPHNAENQGLCSRMRLCLANQLFVIVFLYQKQGCFCLVKHKQYKTLFTISKLLTNC